MKDMNVNETTSIKRLWERMARWHPASQAHPAARFRAFFQMHKQALDNMLRALNRFIALCGSEPGDESGWMRIAEALESECVEQKR